jgi:hypothetical protein
MGINPLQLPTWRDPAPIDWSGLDKIGAALQERADADLVAKALGAPQGSTMAQQGVPLSDIGRSPPPSMRPSVAPAMAGQPRYSVIGSDSKPAAPVMPAKDGMLPVYGDDATMLPASAMSYGSSKVASLDPKFVAAVADIESGGDPNNRTGSYRGLFQLSPDQAQKYPNSMEGGATLLGEIAGRLKQRLGRDPTPTEVYLAHQQGEGGLSAHLSNPDAPAWQNMLSTAEGRAKGPGWARQAIWGNVPDDVKAQFGNVDNITSQQFVDLWNGKLARRMGGDAAQFAGPGVPSGQPTPSRGGVMDQLQAALPALLANPRTRPMALQLLQQQQAQQQHQAQLELSRQQQAEASRHNQASEDLQRRTLEGGKAIPGWERGPDGRMSPIPGGPEDPEYLRRRAESTAGAKVQNEVDERAAVAKARGLDPSSPGIQAWILTGKMPREDQQPLSATDKKAIMEADDSVLAAQTAIDNLTKAKELSGKAYSGPFASERGYAASLLGNEAGSNTVDLNNLVTTNALSQLKSIFGAAPTEGERKILLDIQGSARLGDTERQKVYDRAIQLAQRRLDFNKRNAEAIRGGTYYKPGGAATQPAGQGAASEPAATPPKLGDVKIPIDAARDLQSNPTPERRRYFDQLFGEGASDRVAGPQR